MCGSGAPRCAQQETWNPAGLVGEGGSRVPSHQRPRRGRTAVRVRVARPPAPDGPRERPRARQSPESGPTATLRRGGCGGGEACLPNPRPRRTPGDRRSGSKPCRTRRGVPFDLWQNGEIGDPGPPTGRPRPRCPTPRPPEAVSFLDSAWRASAEESVAMDSPREASRRRMPQRVSSAQTCARAPGRFPPRAPEYAVSFRAL